MKIRRDGLSDESRGSFFYEGHLTDDALLLNLDGELAPTEVEIVDAHVHGCWSCRARRDTIARGIGDFADFQNAFLAPHLPPSPAGKAVFMARLDELAGGLGRPSLLRFWRRVIGRFFVSIVPARPIWIAALLLIATALPYFYWTHRPQILSPDELLGRAVMSEERSLKEINQAVLIEKLRIRTGDHVITRTVYRDVSRKRVASRTDVSTAQEEIARIAFARTGLDWDDPLSAHHYEQWKQEHKPDWSAVRPLGGGLIRLDTESASGIITEASLTVRLRDYHAVEESLRLRDHSLIEVAELSTRVVGLSELNPEIFGSDPIMSPVIARAGVSPSKRMLPNAAQLAIRELEVRSALHGLGADLGEQIEVRTTSSGLVVVEGIATDEARKRQLLAMLHGIPGAETRIETVSQVAIQRQPDNATRASERSMVVAVSGSIPLLDSQLRQRFPDQDQRAAYVNQALSMAQGASARAWALDRLAQRYSPAQIALLDVSTRQSLTGLINDHLTALREDLARLQNQLASVLSFSSNTAAANTGVNGEFTTNPHPVDRADDWRVEVHRIHSSVETVNESVAALLAGATVDNKDSPEVIEVGLRTTFTQLQVELPSLDLLVRKLY